MPNSTLHDRLTVILIETDVVQWRIMYKPTTIAFDPALRIELPSLGGGTRIPSDFAAMAANMIAAVDCESEAYHDLHPAFAGILPRRPKRDIFEEVIEILYEECFVEDAEGRTAALAAFAA